jgi:hypothetical protein
MSKFDTSFQVIVASVHRVMHPMITGIPLASLPPDLPGALRRPRLERSRAPPRQQVELMLPPPRACPCSAKVVGKWI